MVLIMAVFFESGTPTRGIIFSGVFWTLGPQHVVLILAVFLQRDPDTWY